MEILRYMGKELLNEAIIDFFFFALWIYQKQNERQPLKGKMIIVAVSLTLFVSQIRPEILKLLLICSYMLKYPFGLQIFLNIKEMFSFAISRLEEPLETRN